MSTTPGLAILGAGLFAKLAYLPALVALKASALPLKAVYSRSESSATAFATAIAGALNLAASDVGIYHDEGTKTLDTLLARSDVSAVLIVLPITLQPAIILKSLAAGKHVLSEKPVAADVASGKKLIATYVAEYKPKGLVWRVAENYETEPGYRAAGEAIKSGKIGKVAFFTARVINHIAPDSNQWYKTSWRTVPDYQGGFLLDGGVHTVAALRTVLPEAITHISGFASLNKQYLPPHDTVMTIAKGDSFHGSVDITFANPTPAKPSQGGIVVTGERGWLSVEQLTPPGASGPVFRVKIVTTTEDGGEKEEIIEEAVSGVEKEISSFFAAIGGADDGLGDPEGALQDVAFIQASLTSNGALIDLRQIN